MASAAWPWRKCGGINGSVININGVAASKYQSKCGGGIWRGGGSGVKRENISGIIEWHRRNEKIMAAASAANAWHRIWRKSAAASKVVAKIIIAKYRRRHQWRRKSAAAKRINGSSEQQRQQRHGARAKA
jgi:hypothetical protein